MQQLKFLFLAVLAAGLVTLGACGGSDDGSDSGTVQLALTDAVDHNFSEVVVSIREVRAVPAGGEGNAEEGLPLIVSYDTPKTVNVLDLAYQQELLGEAVLSAGTYKQIRLVLERNTDPLAPANYIVMTDDPDQTKIPLVTPSGQESGLKVVGKFEVAPGEVTAVVLDFDPARAIVLAGQSGQWLFKPTGIRVVQTEDLLLSYGGIIGTVMQEDGSTDPVTEVPVADATVYAVPEGSETAIAVGLVNAEDGSFRLFLPEGFYELRATADGFETYSTLPTVFEVIEGADTEAGVLLMTPVPENETTDSL